VVTKNQETADRLSASHDPVYGSSPQAVRSRPAWLDVVPLILVVVALIGSVAIPARQTWLITKLLRRTTEILGPARVLEAQLQAGLAEEIGALQNYAVSADTVFLTRYASAAAKNDDRLAALETLVARLDTISTVRVPAVKEHLLTRRQGDSALVERHDPNAEVAAVVAEDYARYSASLAALSDLSARLRTDAIDRDDQVRALEHLSLASNFALVLAALVALSAVAVLTVRERRLASSLKRQVEEVSARARQEAALREAAEALAGAFTVEEVTRRIAHAALQAVEGDGAFVEQITKLDGDLPEIVRVTAVAGTGVPNLETTCRFGGSFTEFVSLSGKPALIPELGRLEHSGTLDTLKAVSGSGIIVPLGAAGRAIGALFVLNARSQLHSDDVARAAIFGHLAALAYEKVHLLDEAIDAQRRLERVISSRSRLMRGFSHDVKNPIGAADGYAELLTAEVYGELEPQQLECVERMRRCMHTALSLIEDLHELARAETGHLALMPEPVDLEDVVRRTVEEYQAAALAGGLSLSVSVDTSLPSVVTSRLRVQQIASNLLSNAIKYTATGSVTVRTLRRDVGPFGENGGWAVVEFIDTGRGIPPTRLDFIFEEFGRVGPGDKPGAGLGLAISRLLAQALGGHISVKSELGMGSTFTLWLPIHGPETPGPSPASLRSLLREEQGPGMRPLVSTHT
jgi:signal transduction histidine kinase